MLQRCLSRFWHSLLMALIIFCLIWQNGTSSYDKDHIIEQQSKLDIVSRRENEIYRLAKAAEMRNYMKTSVNPCDDFYTYTCGNWKRINPPNDRMKTDTFQAVTRGYNVRVLRYLTAPKLTTESDMQRKVKYFYESCLDREQMGRRYRERLLNIAEEFGGFPLLKGNKWRADEFDWQQVAARILRKYGQNLIVGINIAPDLINSEVNRLYIGQWDYLITPAARGYYDYLKYTTAAEMVNLLDISPAMALKASSEMMQFEKELAAGISDPLDGLGMADLTRLRQLDEMSEVYRPIFNVSRFVTEWLGYEYRLPVYEYVDTYFVQLRRVMMNTPLSVVANYMLWQLLQNFQMEPAANEDEQRNNCVDKTQEHFFKYLDRMVHRQLLNEHPRTFEDVDELWHQVKRAFGTLLQGNRTAAWMTEKTRDKALEKLDAVKLTIGPFSEDDIEGEFSNLIVSSNNFFFNLASVLELRGNTLRSRLDAPPKLEPNKALIFSAAYIREQNRLILPVSEFLPFHFWDERYPMALKYATLGYTLGHELAHAFDDELRQYDAHGNLADWWDRESTQAYTERKACFKQQMSEFRFRGLRMPLSNAQNENIADNVGIRTAFFAYEVWLLQQQLNATALAAEHLPHMPFTARQIFFIGLSQMWCAETRPEWRRTAILYDEHPPEEIRITSMMTNFEEFAHAFNCRRGAIMNPHRKCNLF